MIRTVCDKQPSAEIEVTEEMIEAGYEALVCNTLLYDHDRDDTRNAIAEVFLAMKKASA